MIAKNQSYQKILTKQEYFERIKEKTNNNLAPELTPREKIKSQVSSKQNGDVFKKLLRGWTSLFSRMLENITAGSLEELKYSEMFQTVFGN